MNDLSQRLCDLEARFGGMHRNVKRGRVSPHDPRTRKQLAKGGMVGGDRMTHHGYAPAYARHLPDLIEPIVLVELGILRGLGLAIWCELLPPGSRVIGLEIDLAHFERNRPDLERRGAFARIQPEVYEFDELAETADGRLDEILQGALIDVMIDDALHTTEAQLKALHDFMPAMAAPSVYFVEDNASAAEPLTAAMPETGRHYGVESAGRLTVLTIGADE